MGRTSKFFPDHLPNRPDMSLEEHKNKPKNTEPEKTQDSQFKKNLESAGITSQLAQQAYSAGTINDWEKTQIDAVLEGSPVEQILNRKEFINIGSASKFYNNIYQLARKISEKFKGQIPGLETETKRPKKEIPQTVLKIIADFSRQKEKVFAPNPSLSKVHSDLAGMKIKLSEIKEALIAYPAAKTEFAILLLALDDRSLPQIATELNAGATPSSARSLCMQAYTKILKERTKKAGIKR